MRIQSYTKPYTNVYKCLRNVYKCIRFLKPSKMSLRKGLFENKIKLCLIVRTENRIRFSLSCFTNIFTIFNRFFRNKIQKSRQTPFIYSIHLIFIFLSNLYKLLEQHLMDLTLLTLMMLPEIVYEHEDLLPSLLLLLVPKYHLG